ncbi:MAG: TIGR00730 family Rossman fold protein [Cytophagales bacterium]|nr:TIGR00730 family Rossman fold protein [Cytophagales bacterium]
MDSYSVALHEEIMGELRTCWDVLSGRESMIALFGSSMLGPSDPYYEKAEKIAFTLAEAGFGIITGGGIGLMAAANGGFMKGSARSERKPFGLCLKFPEESSSGKSSPNLSKVLYLKHVLVRKWIFLKYSKGAVFLPGGLGTLDELFEFLTMVQIKKINPIPLVLIGRSYWQDLRNWLEKNVSHYKTISPEDLSQLRSTDDIQEAVAWVTGASEL